MAKPFVLERTFDAPVKFVWQALTQKELMKQWYFDLAEFKAEVGFQFEFPGGPSPERQYIHHCEVTEVVFEKKLTYSWAYIGYEGKSFLTFELFPEGEKTKLVLTHADIETFPASNPDFAKHNFEGGWNHIINISLKEFLENKK